MSEAGRELVPVVTVPVHRHGRLWVVELPADGVWTCGRSLDQARERSHAALALAREIGLDQVTVRVRLDGPEMDALEQARERERAALAAAVVRLRSQAVPWPEVARLLQVSQREARQAFAEASATTAG
ncbi:hypothetical protein [Glycomyces sp. MUSA5-2]|uniref:hypothetical protein n=1 Tax=Glycomyces sp. MUSA5-2 TaxID=2053002 RepID=UPI003009A97D